MTRGAYELMTEMMRMLSGWGHVTSRSTPVWRPEALSDLCVPDGQGVARGLGRSYGDAAIGRNFTIDMSRLDRMLGFSNGVLSVEAGVSLKDILDTWLPRGWFLPVTPGTQWVTVGGAIASDVHGKNHHQAGSFGRFVRSFHLLTANGNVLLCSPTQHADVFWAVIGGMGLLGIILQADITLIPVASPWMMVEYWRTEHLEETLAWFRERGQQHPYNVCWIDPMRGGKHLGRAIVMAGRHATEHDPVPQTINSAAKTARLAPPMPAALLRARALGTLFNAAYYRVPRHQGEHPETVAHYFYPLDALANWYRIYGPAGFVQYQAVFPLDITPDALARIFGDIQRARHAAYTGVLKIMGEASPGLLSFPRPGITLAIDLPWYGPQTRSLMTQLYARTLDYGGRVYLAKDACLDPATFRAMYPHWKPFLEVKHGVDPQHRWSSDLSRRIGLVPKGRLP